MYLSREGHWKISGKSSEEISEDAFRGGIGTATSFLEVDEADPNRSNAFVVVPMPLTRVRGKDVFPPWIPPLVVEAFSVRLSPELPKLNFLLSFRALASANS
jgi:hypothetical protein